jgi:hypothetical protein
MEKANSTANIEHVLAKVVTYTVLLLLAEILIMLKTISRDKT